MTCRSELSGGRWTLSADGTPLIEHTPDAPFITAVRREKSARSLRGGVKTQAREVERVPLGMIDRPSENAVRFSGGDHRVTAVLSEARGGVRLALSGEDGWAYEFRLPAIDGEAVFGGGAQPRKLDLRGETVICSAAASDRPSPAPQKPPLSFGHPRRDACPCAAAPVFVTDRGRLILFDTTAGGVSHLDADAYRFCFDRCPDTLLLARGADYRTLSRTLAAELPNRQYIPRWCHDGMILGMRGGTDAVLNRTVAMLDAGAAVCGVWCPDWSGGRWSREDDEALYPRLRDAIGVLNDQGVRFLAEIEPCLARDGRLYRCCKEHGWLIRRQNGEVYHNKSISGDAGIIDLTNPDASVYVKDVLIKENLLDLGVLGWMAGCGGSLPADCVLRGGEAELGSWPLLWAKLNREAIEEYGADDAFFFMRPGGFGVQAHAPVLCSSAQPSAVSGLSSAISSALSLGFSGVPLTHFDVSGTLSSGKRGRGGEALIRSMELAAFSPLMCVAEATDARSDARFDDDAVKPHAVRLSNVHKALGPYLEACAAQSREGIPSMRPDFYESISFASSRDPNSYFLGDDLFVCPVVKRGASARKVFLPRGVWVHFWSGKVYTGGEGYTVPAPPGEIPVFYRASSDRLELFRAAAHPE